MNILRTWAVRYLLAGLVVMTAASAALAAQAGQPPPQPREERDSGAGMMPGQMGPGGMMGPGMMGGGMMGTPTRDRPWITVMLDRRQELGLSAEQVGKLFDLRESFQRVAQGKTQELRQAEEELDQMLGPQPVDLAAVEAKLKEIEALRTDLRLSRLKTIEQAKQVLTSDQQKTLAEIADQARSSSGMGSTGQGSQQ